MPSVLQCGNLISSNLFSSDPNLISLEIKFQFLQEFAKTTIHSVIAISCGNCTRNDRCCAAGLQTGSNPYHYTPDLYYSCTNISICLLSILLLSLPILLPLLLRMLLNANRFRCNFFVAFNLTSQIRSAAPSQLNIKHLLGYVDSAFRRERISRSGTFSRP